MLTENPAKLLTSIELAKFLDVHPVTVRRWVTEGRIPCRRIGRAVRFTADDVQKIIGQPAFASAGGHS